MTIRTEHCIDVELDPRQGWNISFDISERSLICEVNLRLSKCNGPPSRFLIRLQARVSDRLPTPVVNVKLNCNPTLDLMKTLTLFSIRVSMILTPELFKLFKSQIIS